MGFKLHNVAPGVAHLSMIIVDFNLHDVALAPEDADCYPSSLSPTLSQSPHHWEAILGSLLPA